MTARCRRPRWSLPASCLLLAAALIGTSQAAKQQLRPRLDPEVDEMVLNKDDELKLRCQSSFAVRWEIPETAEEDAIKTVLFEEERGTDQPFIINLVVPRLHYLQTGYYRCVDNRPGNNGSVNYEDRRRVASVYVYVRDEDELLALDVNHEPITVNSGGQLVIPCRPTAPNITVTLATEGEEIMEDNDEVSFDPKIGFTFVRPHVIDSGEMTCSAKFGNHSSSRSFFVHIPTVSDDVAAPLIYAPNHAIIDSVLELNCSVPFEVPVHLEWVIPYQSGIEHGRIVVSKPREVKQMSDDLTFAVISLKIKKVIADDEGIYTCIVRDNAKHQKEATKYIPVLLPDTSYLNLTVQGGKTNITTTDGNGVAVQWVVYHSAHPEPELIWYDPDDKEIVSSSKYEVHRDTTTTRLVVKKPTIQDTGEYKLKATNAGQGKTIQMFLNVLGGPHLNISIHPYYMLNKEAKVVCTVWGNPLPVVQWFFRQCNFQPPDEQCESKSNVELSQDTYSEEALGRVQLRSILTFPALHSGILQAKACSGTLDSKIGKGSDGLFVSSDNCDVKEERFYVTDVPSGFHIQGPRQTVEGETVHFNCSVSVYHFSNDISWRFNGDPVHANDKFNIHKSSTILSHTSALYIRDVTKDSQGTYTCISHPLHAEMPSERHITLTVKDVKAPTFDNETNLNGNNVKLAEKQSYTLFCLANGLPTPNIRWTKDGADVKVKENMEILGEGKLLTFKYVEPDDAGKYTCEASNHGGTAYRTINLSLIEKPKGVNVGLVVGLFVLAVFSFGVIVYLCIRVRREQKLRQQLTQAGLINFEEGAVENLDINMGVEDQAELLPYDRKFEFPREKLKLGKTLGSGAFGVVVKAEAFGIIDGEPVTPVAVKMVKRSADHAIIKALASELKIMVHLGRHLNVVNLLGACTKGLSKMELYVIVEYCRYGNLHNYLMKHRDKFVDQIDPSTGYIDPSRGAEPLANLPNGRKSSSHSDTMRSERPDSRADYRSQSDSSGNFATGATEATFVCMTPTGEEGLLMSNNSAAQPDWRSSYKGDYKGNINPITTRDLLCYAFQVARGMEYLASRKVLHGDLAARNILLADNNVIKICDFGLAKSVYKDENYLNKGNGPLPIKWMAIESIRDRIFSTQSDVWSFGIVLWEFFSLAKTPYTGMPADEQFYKKLEEGYRMEKPPFSTDDLYTIMMECWRARPILRPSFTELVERLGSMLEDSVRKHYVDLNEPYLQMNDQWQNQSGHNDYLGMFSSPTYTNVVSPLSEDEDEPQRYQNIPRGAPSVVADSSLPGYLTMKSPSPTELDSIFSPTRPGSNGGNVFKFHTPPQGRRQLQDAEVNDHIELRPMLSAGSRKSESTSGHESDSDAMSQYTAVPSSRPVEPQNHIDERHSPLKPTFYGKSISNPSYSFAPDLIASSDNYVNNAKQSNSLYQKPPELISNMPPPTFSTFGRKSNQDVKLPAHYANVPAQRAPLALSESDFIDPPYVN